MTDHAEAGGVSAMALENVFQGSTGAREIFGDNGELGGIRDAKIVWRSG
jgi:hypothetical protein